MKFLNEVYTIDIEAIPKKDREHLICGVYFLWRGDLLVYVGQSENVNSRIQHHYKDRKKNFTSYSVLEIDKKKLKPTERILINKYLPQYNKDPLTKKIRNEHN